MGPLSAWLVAALAFPAVAAEPTSLPGSGGAGATALELAVVEGRPRVGDTVTIEVAASPALVAAFPGEAVAIAVSAGNLVGAARSTAPGRWEQEWRLPTGPAARSGLAVTAALGEVERQAAVVIQPEPAASMQLPVRVDHPASPTTPVTVAVRGGTAPASALQLRTSPATPLERHEVTGGVDLVLRPDDSPLPRIIPVGVRDGRQAHEPPAWTVLRLFGRPRIPVQTDPGSDVLLVIGERSYGPFVAGADGVAAATADVWPGENSATVVARDALGNEQRTTIALGGDPQPALALMASSAVVPGQPLPDVFVAAFRPDGRPWVGSEPACRAGVGEPLALVPTGAGQWRAPLPPTARRLFELQVECELPGAVRQQLRIPTDPSVPADVELRVWPPELDADLPLAQIQAWLEGATGERLAATGLLLQAERGTVTMDTEAGPAVAVAAYDGTAAVGHGEDRLTARWTPPMGSGLPWDLQAGLDAPPSDQLAVAVVALDAGRRPLADVEVVARRGDQATTGRTDAQGRAVLTLPATPGEPGPFAVQLEAAGLLRNRLLVAADARTPLQPWLESSLRLPVRTGQIARISLRLRPGEVPAGSQSGVVAEVRLTDAGGNAVQDAAVTLDAGDARVGRLRPTEDGGLEALLQLPARLPYGELDVALRGADGKLLASDTLTVTPRELRWGLGLAGGGLFGGSGIRSPWIGAELDGRIPAMPSWLVARLSVGSYATRAEATDPSTGQQVRVDTTLIPVSISALPRAQRGRTAFYGGIGLSLTPYQQRTRFGGEIAAAGPGFTAGPEVTAGVGFRLRNSELQLQGSYLYLDMAGGDVRWDGLIGGFRPTLAWKLLL